VNAAGRLAGLARLDKWYLSCGDGVIWAPPFPTWLHRPGFWDEALIFYHPFAPLFSVALIRNDGRHIPLVQESREWRPDRLRTLWRSPAGSRFLETKSAVPGGRLMSTWAPAEGTWRDGDDCVTHLVAFSIQPGDRVSTVSRSLSGSGLEWERWLEDRRGERLDTMATLHTDSNGPVQLAALRSEPAAVIPEWDLTPFAERWSEGVGLRDEVRLEGLDDRGLVYLAVAREAPPSGAPSGAASFAIDISFNGKGDSVAPIEWIDPTEPWIEFYNGVPLLECDDPYVERYLDYRAFGLRLNQLGGDTGHVRYPAVAEGIGYFHVPISYSAQAHMWETRWFHNRELARGSIRNFLARQRPDGSLPGRIYTNHDVGTDFYHANWGDAVLAVAAMEPDTTFLSDVYPGLSRYALWLDATRDREHCGMYDVIDQFETGQEFMSRYQAVDPDADRYGWENRIRLKGVDVTVYTYQLKRALQHIALRLDLPRDSVAWADGAERIGTAIFENMWDPDLGLFTDVNPSDMTRTGVKAAVSFYPLLTDLVTDEQCAQLLGHLTNPCEFWTPFPIPSSSRDDPLFNPDAEWKGKRHNCPWNGRVWPMTNSHVLEGLIRQWHRGRRSVGPTAAEFLILFVKMMFYDQDIERPNCFEHYNPLTGHPSAYRGIDDYQHSWVLDLIIRGIVGLEPRSDSILIDPLPTYVETFALENVLVRGHPLSIRRSGNRIDVHVGNETYRTEWLVPLEIPL